MAVEESTVRTVAAHVAQLRHDPAFRVLLRILTAEHSKGDASDMTGTRDTILRALKIVFDDHITGLKNIKP